VGCRAVRDSTLVAWYRSLYAPRAGGAYDSHHRTAGIAGCTRRRGGGVAARGACATANDAGGRVPPERFARCDSPHAGSFSQWTKRSGVIVRTRRTKKAPGVPGLEVTKHLEGEL